MKTVLTLVVCIFSAAHYAYAQCNNMRQYSQTLVPACDRNDLNIKWPNYENPSSYWTCYGIGNPLLTTCPSGQYFIYVLQQCGTCAQYIPPVPCNQLKTQNTPQCKPIGSGTSGTGAPSGPTEPTPYYPSTSAPTAKTTKSTTPKASTPPTESTSNIPTPPGETTSGGISGPPTPVTSAPGVPTPPTPAPTPPNVEVSPPTQPPSN